jgi:sugar phosphate isomerase/epimerase
LLRLGPELRLAVENHKLTPEGFATWADANANLTLDVEHLWKFTRRDGPLEDLLQQLQEFLTNFAGKLRHVHLPGYWPGLPEHRPMYCARDMIFPVLSLLDRSGFEGFVVSEVNLIYQNLEELSMDVLLVEAWRKASKSGETAQDR